MAGLGLNIAGSLETAALGFKVSMFEALTALAAVYIFVLLGVMAVVWVVTVLRRDVYTPDKRGASSPISFAEITGEAFDDDVVDAEFDD